ncbi:outer membrane beta-barrel protein [Roseateles sp. NT4]|uniref:outer membrane beta-barrel protein n=1 Tax=Roseateles sp. NT4 TaxID=3453715 RepID=UPI003EEBD639
MRAASRRQAGRPHAGPPLQYRESLMKKYAFVVAALFGAATAQAAEPNPSAFYIGAAAGSTHLNVDCTGTTICDSSDNGRKLMGGYSFGNGFSLEGSYINFGKAHVGNAASSIRLKPSAFVLGGAYSLPLASDWGMVVRLGVAQVKVRADLIDGPQQGSASESETQLVAGVAVSYAVSNRIKLELGVDSTKAHFEGQTGNVRLISLGATFAF